MSKYAVIFKVTHKNLKAMTPSQARRFSKALKQLWAVTVESSTPTTKDEVSK